ncbi:hypothetical protein [Nostoc sp. FACHB-145]|uniref:hypothetical protein n=1 Tax=Nostoc sp. FACHB-145 TaxID=2692836 RepID=UPI00168465DA|nr:hypothetical protein [Nostoc sp. FACHB-145]MBD2469757.1 hypothetical protein [Nostoc sp. FACHB-145]
MIYQPYFIDDSCYYPQVIEIFYFNAQGRIHFLTTFHQLFLAFHVLILFIFRLLFTAWRKQRHDRIAATWATILARREHGDSFFGGEGEQ